MRFDTLHNDGLQPLQQHSLEGGALLGKNIQLGGIVHVVATD